MNKIIKNIIKIGIFIGAVVGTMHAINRYIEKASKHLNKLKKEEDSYYKWRLGNIYYKKTGEGDPILLIHDFTPYASSYEWTNLVDKLSTNHTVYTIDLLGCGRSDKPAITYTNFMYVQMVTDFINDIIGEKTNIITSGHSSSIGIMSTNYTCENIGSLILINPCDLKTKEKVPSTYTKIANTILTIPILGTFLYNMIVTRKNINSFIEKDYLYDSNSAHDDIADIYYEAAHYNNCNGKHVMTSIIGNYMESNVAHAIKSCENSVLIIGGECYENVEEVIEEYKTIKPQIESIIIDKTKKLPHFETANDVYDEIIKYI